jgi:predicted CoA-binding protein
MTERGGPVKTTIRQIEDFLAEKRVAVVGVSRNPKEISNTLWHELRERRYEAVPVNPATSEIDGQRCFANVAEIDPPVGAALIMTPPDVAQHVVEQCVEAGITHVWLYGGFSGKGATSPVAIDYARAHGVDVVAEHCPYMFLPGTPFFHGLHAVGKKLTGSYPAKG